MNNVNTDLLSAVHTAPEGGDHKVIAKVLEMRSDNARRTLASHRKRGFIDPDKLSLTPEGLKLLEAGRDTLAESKADDAATPLRTKEAATAPASVASSAPPTSIPLNLIDRSPLNYRTTFDKKAIAELADSIFQKGLLQAIGVRPKTDITGDRYEVIFGERRWRAMRKLVEDGRWPEDVKIEAISRDLDDVETLELMVTENSLREDVHPLQEADAIVKLQAAREDRGEAPDLVCNEIATSLGRTTRWAQRRAKMAKGLSKKCRKAYEADKFTNFATAELLARYPDDVQNDCLEALTRDWNPLRTVDEVQAFLDKRSMPVGDQLRFSLEEYEARGGTYIEDDETGERRLAQPGIADTLTEKWIASECKTIIEKRGYTIEPVRRSNHSDWYYPKATKKLNIPIEFQCICVIKDTSTLEVKIIHPCYNREDYERYEAKQKKKVETEDGDEVKPLPRGLWKLGGQARTNQVRKGVEKSPSAAMALIIASTFDQIEYQPSLCFLKTASVTGDEGDQPENKRFETLCQPPLKNLELAPIHSWDKDSPQVLKIVDRGGLMEELLARDDLVELFCARVADLCIDGQYTSHPGAKAESLALHKLGIVADPGGAFVNEDHVSKMSKAQMICAIDAYRIQLDTVEVDQMRKAEAAKAVSEAFPASVTPIEARFIDHDTAKAAEKKLLEGKKV